MVSNTELTSNYFAISNLPIVKRTLKALKKANRENKKLYQENNMLKKMVDLLLNKHNSYNANNKDEPLVEVKVEKTSIKQEKTNIKQENIIYKLEEYDSDDVKMQDKNIVNVSSDSDINICPSCKEEA